MHIRNLILIVSILFLNNIAFAQSVVTSDNDEQKIESVAEQNDEVIDFSELQDQLNIYKDNPIDLNYSTTEELQHSGLFNALQIAALENHISKNGKLIRLEELQSINEFDLKNIHELLPYIKISGPLYDIRLHPKNLLEEGKQQLTLRWQRITEKQKGYSDDNINASKYAGDPNQLKLKYRFTSGRYFSFGITAEKDAGEQFFKGAQKDGFDFYSFHLFIKPGKLVKVIALGDYQVQFAQGLVAWSGLAFGKSSDVINIKKQASGIKPYTSSNEFSFLRGAAFSLEIKGISLDNWISIRKLDANTITADTLSDFSEISSIGTSGLHRNDYEIADENAVTQKVAGAHLQWIKKSLKLELTAELAHYSVPLVKGNDVYQLYNFSGKDLADYSAAYTWQLSNFNFFGETAIDKNGNVATLNGFLAALDPAVSFSLIQRSYNVDYNSINANPFREGTKPQNEKGIYAGLQFMISRQLKSVFYFDEFKFPWLRYQLDASGKGYEWLSQITYSPSRTTELYFRIKHQNKLTDEKLHEHPIDHQFEQGKTNIRFNANFKLGPSVKMLSRVEWVKVQSTEAEKQQGILFLQEFHYQPLGKPFGFVISYQLFNTAGYDARVYAYEQDIPGSSSIPSSSYEGDRYYAMIRYHYNRHLDIWFRYGRTIYDNLTEIGSSGEYINGNHKSEVKAQIRYSF